VEGSVPCGSNCHGFRVPRKANLMILQPKASECNSICKTSHWVCAPVEPNAILPVESLNSSSAAMHLPAQLPEFVTNCNHEAISRCVGCCHRVRKTAQMYCKQINLLSLVTTTAARSAPHGTCHTVAALLSIGGQCTVWFELPGA